MFATMVETDQTRLWFVNLWVKATVTGTSFAAPWITRKMAYLIHVMGLSREVAKALIIDSAAGWDRQDTIKYEKRYGIVPKKIEDILYSRDDEIRFIMAGSIDEYEVYTYNIPVPQNMNAHPFLQKLHLPISLKVIEIKVLIIHQLRWIFILGGLKDKMKRQLLKL